ncbi:MAG: COX15/CtaA family protein [Pseudomonadota bacterium]
MTLAADHTLDFTDARERNRAMVRSWLYFICFLIFVMVIVGGATRLTDSGLSITEWKPLLGAIPPLNAADWEIAFNKYREIPEYTQINKGMSLAEFKFIYWWEWGHRFLGRIIGIAFAIPLIYFWVTGRLEQFLKPRLLLLLVLGGLQGFIGWWMVKSGLVERVDVSQYRLAVHLTLACLIFAYSMWLARGLAPHSNEYATKMVAIFAPITVAAIVLQIFLGALVAGLDAGLSFNDWPLMDGAVVPDNLWVQSPAWVNMFENPKTVQFIHRMSAYAVLALIAAQMIVAYRSESGETHKRRTVVLLSIALVQAAIGIVTLVLQVPLSWALLHQGGAVVLLGFAVAHWRGIAGTYP